MYMPPDAVPYIKAMTWINARNPCIAYKILSNGGNTNE